ncbi:universal stress protein [Paraburkholderia monticola]|uniref:universal stress protein n=1 Tax=Paraburkholderia monticola TaxID=1399968 RepID=UPI0009503487|nr:universal stress protein [Paraburkholderia monticola]
MYKHILVAVGLKPDLTTLKSAIEIARESGARVTGLHVVDPLRHFPALADDEFHGMLEAFEAHGRTVVDRTSRVLDEAQCQGEAQMRRLPSCGGTVGQVIAQTARELGADLVILGSRDPGWFRLYLQNVQKDVVRRSTCPVLVITPPCVPKARQARSMKMHRVEQFGQAQPENLHANAEDRERE